MTIDRLVLAFAGGTVLIGLVLGFYVHPYGYALSAFMGANLMQASVTGFCPMAALLRRLGVHAGTAF